MRIAFVVGAFPVLSEKFIVDQITGLLRLGHEVDVYAVERGNTAKVHPDVTRFDLLSRTRFLSPAATRGRHLPRAGWNLGRILLSEISRALDHSRTRSRRLVGPILHYLGSALPEGSRYDLIHCHFGPVGAAMARLCRAGWLEGPLVTSFHGWDATVFPQMHPREPYRVLFEVGSLFTVNSDHIGAKLAALGCPAERLVKHPVGIEPEAFPFAPRSLRDGEPVRLATVARLVPEKGLEFSIRAVARLVRALPGVEIEYTIAGDGPLAPALRSLIAELGLAKSVRLAGGMDAREVRDLLAASHIFVLASIRADNGAEEGAGVVLMEAQAAGLPVVATRVGGIREVVREGESALLVPERDEAALAGAIRWLIERPERWARMGRVGRAWVEESFDVAVLNRRLVRRYGEVAR